MNVSTKTCLALAILVVDSFAHAKDPRLREQPGKPYTAEQILNGDAPGRKASPAVKEFFDDDGFAKERLYHVPAPGVHPRVLFGPQDLPRIREQLRATETGKLQLDGKRKIIGDTIDKPGTWENDCFVALHAGDIMTFRAVYTGPKTKIQPGPPGTIANPLIVALQDRAFLALVDDDEVASRELAAATVTLAKSLLPEVEAAAATPDGMNYWRTIRKVCGDGAAIGFLYDFTQPFMTAEQATTVRGLIVKMTRGRYSHGMELPPHWRNWNHIGLALYFPLIALSIEGEEGYDPRIVARGAEVMHDNLKYSVSTNGIGKEGIGYHTAGMGHLTFLAVALANRGDKILTSGRFRKQIEDWCVWAMQPYGGEWLSSGDLGTFPPDLEFAQAVKFFYPSNSKIDYVFQNLPFLRQLEQNKPRLQNLTLLQLITPVDPTTNDFHAGADFKMPNTLYDQTFGYLFMRDGWNVNAATLQLVARCDTTFASHDFADRGTFFISALGRPWSLSGFRETEPQYCNTIMIDGRGQGYFATPAKWLGVADTPLATFAAVDLKYCYDWRWVKPPMVFTPQEFAAQPRLAEFKEPAARLQSHSSHLKWERDPLPQVIDYYSGYLAGNSLMWDEDSWVMRATNCTVQRAFRMAGLVRGKHSYALIVDDIQKDDAERFYEWHMMMPNDVEAVSIKKEELILSPPTGTTVPFRVSHDRWRNIGAPVPQKGDPLLLVRILEIVQPATPTFQPNPALESVELIKHDDLHQNYLRDTGLAKRLTFPSRSAAPNYKVLLYPFRQGDPLPVTTWNTDNTQLIIEHDGVKDEYAFTRGVDGRTRIQLQRGAERVVTP